jgi:hypothetical protein
MPTDNFLQSVNMVHVGFEPTISASERSQTYAFDREATGISQNWL